MILLDKIRYKSLQDGEADQGQNQRAAVQHRQQIQQGAGKNPKSRQKVTAGRLTENTRVYYRASSTQPGFLWVSWLEKTPIRDNCFHNPGFCLQALSVFLWKGAVWRIIWVNTYPEYISQEEQTGRYYGELWRKKNITAKSYTVRPAVKKKG